MKNPTPVVVGLIRQEKKVLLGLRPSKDSQDVLKGYWEFPGGKMKWGESPKEALQRELKEELHIIAQIDHLRMAHSYIYAPDHAVLLLFYDVTCWKGTLKNLYHVELRWVLPSQLSKYRLLPANRSILPDILSIL